jgi:hypothetical protein
MLLLLLLFRVICEMQNIGAHSNREPKRRNKWYLKNDVCNFFIHGTNFFSRRSRFSSSAFGIHKLRKQNLSGSNACDTLYSRRILRPAIGFMEETRKFEGLQANCINEFFYGLLEQLEREANSRLPQFQGEASRI